MSSFYSNFEIEENLRESYSVRRCLRWLTVIVKAGIVFGGASGVSVEKPWLKSKSIGEIATHQTMKTIDFSNGYINKTFVYNLFTFLFFLQQLLGLH